MVFDENRGFGNDIQSLMFLSYLEVDNSDKIFQTESIRLYEKFKNNRDILLFKLH